MLLATEIVLLVLVGISGLVTLTTALNTGIEWHERLVIGLFALACLAALVGLEVGA